MIWSPRLLVKLQFIHNTFFYLCRKNFLVYASFTIAALCYSYTSFRKHFNHLNQWVSFSTLQLVVNICCCKNISRQKLCFSSKMKTKWKPSDDHWFGVERLAVKKAYADERMKFWRTSDDSLLRRENLAKAQKWKLKVVEDLLSALVVISICCLTF